ncbi:MAG: hypothetical protein ACI4HQ_09115 [Acetatifactor sp.]
MKRKIIVLMTIACLFFWGKDMSVFAAEYVYCPYCSAALFEQGQHMNHWSTSHTFTDNSGKSITCTEFHSVDRKIKVCPNGCGVIWIGDAVETVTHSLSECPYK